MDDVKYKEYTPEESMIYDEAMARIRKALGEGMTFPEACALADIKDPQLKAFVVDDALKVAIGEMHFGKGKSLEELSRNLQVPPRALFKAVAEMLEDAGIAAAEAYRQGTSGPVGTA